MFRLEYDASDFVLILSEGYESTFPSIFPLAKPNGRMRFYTFRFDTSDDGNTILRDWLDPEEPE